MNYLKLKLTANLLLQAVFIIGLSQNIFSQELVNYHYSMDQGLPSDEVYFAMQDSKGFIWFATNNGVSRFNGTDFENFGKEHGLPDLTVFEIYEDYRKRIWFITYSGKLAYYSNDSIYQYKYNNKLKPFSKRSAGPIKYGFYVDSNETIYLSLDRHGLIKICNNGILEKVKYTNSNNVSETYLINDTVSILQRGYPVFQNKKHYYIKALNKEIRYNDSIGPYHDFKIIGKYENASCFIGFSSTITKVSSNGELKVYKHDTLISIVALHLDNENNLWVGLLSGGLLFFKDADITQTAEHYFKNQRTITSVLHDNENGYWFTTYSNGVYYVPNINTRVLCNKESMQKEKYSSVAIHDNIVFGGHKKSNTLVAFKNNTHELLYVGMNLTSCIHSIECLDNKVYIGNAVGVNILNYASKSNVLINAGSVQSITKINESIYYGTSSGYSVFKKNKLLFRSNRLLDDKVGGFSYKINAIFKYKNSLLLGCPNGLWSYTNEKLENLATKSELLNNRVLDINCNTDSSILFIATKEAGIVVIETDTIWNIANTNGLSSNYVTSLAINRNTLWAGTNLGLNKIIFDENDGNLIKIRQYNQNHGLTSNMINDVKYHDSTLYLATNNGICIFNENSIKTNTRKPQAIIYKVRINGTDTLLQKEYRLNYWQNSIEILYRGITYKNFNKIIYKYRFKGGNTSWVKTTNNNTQFISLQPGKYKFEVMAANEDGIWSQKPATIDFVIQPPYWRRWWFYCSILLLLFLFGALIIKARFKAISKKNKLNTELIKIRQQALGSQMNPHFIFNSLNSIQNFILESNLEKSQEYLSDFASLMRKVLNNSQHSIISLYEELSALKLYIGLEKLRFSNSFEFELIVDNSIDLTKISLPPLLLQPYVENAIWHGLMPKKDNRELTISIKLKGNEVACEIVDNGVGRKLSNTAIKRKRKTYNSMGTNITHKRIQLFNMINNAQMRVEYIDLEQDGNSCGTKVTCFLPLLYS